MLTENRERTRLVVQRKSGEVLWIGDARLLLTVKGGRVTCVVEAPKETRVLRDELRTRAA